MPATELKRRIIEKLTREDVEERVAKAAVQAEDNRKADYDDIYLWCLEHGDDVDITDLARSFDQDIGWIHDCGHPSFLLCVCFFLDVLFELLVLLEESKLLVALTLSWYFAKLL